ncbi:MAG: hypothetical protein AAF617_08675 [Bacteroidota bacterium]
MYYTPSGKFNLICFLYLLLAVFIAVPLLALIYTYAIFWIPIVYLNILCVVGIAFGLGYVANFVVGMGKVRSKLLAFFIGCMIGMAGLYASWIIWLHAHMNEFVSISFVSLIDSPMGVWKIILELNSSGTWGIGRSSSGNVTGTLLTIVWILELLAMIATPLFFAYSKAREPFLETDNIWADTRKIGPFAFITDKKVFKKQLEAKNFQRLVDMSSLDDSNNSSHSILTIYYNQKRTLGSEYYVSVSNMKERITKKGTVTHDESLLLQFLRVPKEIAQQLLDKIGTSGDVSGESKE